QFVNKENRKDNAPIMILAKKSLSEFDDFYLTMLEKFNADDGLINNFKTQVNVFKSNAKQVNDFTDIDENDYEHLNSFKFNNVVIININKFLN
ncbi:hypothetical protein ACWIVU_10890, partial [Ursidibacter arcticus]